MARDGHFLYNPDFIALSLGKHHPRSAPGDRKSIAREAGGACKQNNGTGRKVNRAAYGKKY
jgi:hypothetical protein